MEVTRPKHRWRWVGLVTIAAMLGAFSLSGPAGANLSQSNFEGNDGNLVRNATGNSDWEQLYGSGLVHVGLDANQGKSDSSFGQGTKEDVAGVSVVTGSIPPNKSDLTRFYEAAEYANGSNYLYLAWERSNVLGSANMDFEINQKTTTGFDGTPGSVTLNRTAGDLLVTYDFGGSGQPMIGLLKWVTTGAVAQCFSAAALPCWGNRVDMSAAGFAEAAVNSASVPDPISGQTLAGQTFGEAAINLTAAGVFPAAACQSFGSTFLKSRSSTSFSAEVKDFIAPTPVFVSNCGRVTVRKVAEHDPNTSGTQFSFTTAGLGAPSSFNLKNGGSQLFDPVPPGSSYSVTESTEPSSNWALSGLSCTATPAGTSGGTRDGATATVNITIAPDGIVDCTYTNTFTKNETSIATLLSESSGLIGDSVNDTATLSGNTSDAGGTVSYTVYTDSSCTLGAQSAGTVAVTKGSVPASNSVSFTSAGTWYWQAVYTGDANNAGATSLCTDEKLVIAQNSPTIATTLSETTGKITDTVHDSSTLSGVTKDAGGTVTYTVYTDSSCTQGAQSAGTKTVTNGVVPDSSSVTFNSAGTWYWQAVYSGDANNGGASSTCTDEQLVIKTNGPSVATTLSESTGKVGDSVHDSATLSGETSDAGGTVTYTVYTDSSCTQGAQSAGTRTVTDGVVSDSNAITFNTAGTWYWQAVYSGDANNDSATSICTDEKLVIKPNQAALSTAQNIRPNDSAAISDATNGARGTVTFNLFAPGNETCTGSADYSQTVDVNGNGTYNTTNSTFTATTPGMWRWQVIYSGDDNNVGATSSCGTEAFTIKNS